MRTCVLCVHVYMHVVDMRVDAVLEINFTSFMLDLYFLLYRYFTLWEFLPASGLVESRCDPLLWFHMRTHCRPADLVEASCW